MCVTRRTLKFIKSYPASDSLYSQIKKSDGWPYKTDKQFYKTRDKALCAILYVLALRISEALRLKITQFEKGPSHVTVRAIKLSKSMRKGKPRQSQYREEGFLPLIGERKKFTYLILDYLEIMESYELETLFPFKRARAFQIVSAVLGIPCHWLRAYGENFLYDVMQKDVLAVSDYIKIDPRTLQLYLRRRYSKYPIR